MIYKKKLPCIVICISLICGAIMINCTSCNMLRTNDQSSTKISNAKISDYIKNTIEFDVITNMEDLVNQHDSLSDSYQAEIEVTTVNILEIGATILIALAVIVIIWTRRNCSAKNH